MKLVVAVVQDYDCDRLLRVVTGAGLRATRLASTGGFLRTGNTTVVMGVPDDRVTDCLRIARETCGRRLQRAADVEAIVPELYPLGVTEVAFGGGVVFVVNVERFVRLIDGRGDDG